MVAPQNIATARRLTTYAPGMSNSATSLGLAVEEKSIERILVRELSNGKGDYEFDWEAKCIRKGYEDYRVIRPHQDFEFARVDRKAKDRGEQTA